MDRTELIKVIKMLNDEEGLLAGAELNKIKTVGKGTKVEDLKEAFRATMIALDEADLIGETPEDCVDFFEAHLEEFTKGVVKEVEVDKPEEEEVDEEVEASMADKKPDKKPEKKAGKKSPKPAENKLGVIASILIIISEAKKPISFDSIADELSKRFPERERDRMLKTVKAQIGGKKRPNRMEREKEVELVFTADGGVMVK